MQLRTLSPGSQAQGQDASSHGAVSLQGGSDVMPETKLEIFQNQLLGNLFEPGQLHPGYALHLTIAQEFVVGFADNDNTALPANKSPVDNVRKGG